MKKNLLFLLSLLLLFWSETQAQNRTITGKVTASEDGSPIPGATVQVKGSSIATNTDAEGSFSIQASSSQTLVFSFVGFANSEQSVGNRSVINVSLDTDLKLLDELVVTGVAGATSRKKLTVSVAKVGGDKLSIVPATSAAGALTGKVAGLKTSAGGGSPGANVDLLLRGDNNLNTSSAPLLLVDGIILTGSLADLNVDDIESIEVVKGAAAAALYGSRAGNGVIAVTTKRGSSGSINKTDIVVRNEIGSSQIAKYLETAESHVYALADDWQTAQGRYTKYKGVTYPADYAGGGYDPRITGSRSIDTDGYMDNPYGVYRDMQSDIFRTGTNLTNFVSVSNRTDRGNVYLSFENNLQQGVMKLTDGYNRQNFRINVDHHLTKWLKVSASNLFLNRTTNTPSQSNGIFYNIARLEKDVDVFAKNPDGQPYYVRFNHFNDETENPLYYLYKRKQEAKTRRWLANYSANVRLTSWADLDLTQTMEISNFREEIINPMDTWQRSGGVIEDNYQKYSGGSISHSTNESKTANSQFTLNLNRKFGDLSTRAKLSYLYENRHYESNYMYGQKFVISGIENFKNIRSEDITSGDSYQEDERAQNYFAILGLDYKDRYLFDGMYRYDGSSLFGPDARWNSYYRLSGAYRISEDVKINGIDELKVRVAHGTAGIRPNFAWQYEVYSLSSGNTSPSQKGNRLLKPSTTAETEIGINVDFLKKFTFEATYAMSVTKDQFLNVPLVAFLNDGFPNQWQNAGEVKSNTFEFTLGANWYKKKDFSWNTNIVFSKVNQKITKLPIPPYSPGGQDLNGDQGNLFRIAEGEVYGAIYGYKMIRTLEEMAQQLPEGKTIGDYEINSDGYVVPKGSQGTASEMPIKKLNADGTPWYGKIGNGNPDFIAGITNTVTYKNFQFYLLLDWKQGGDIYNGKEQRLAFNNVSKRQDMTNVPQDKKKVASYIGSNTGFYDANNANAYWVEDGTYVKVRELAIGYNLPSRWVKGFSKGINARLIGRNLLTFTNYSGYDPEVGSIRFPVDGIYANPLYRQYAFSLTLNF